MGQKVYAYNESTDKNELQPILEIISHGDKDQEVTYLSLRDDESLRHELIVTTPGHPFYLEKNVDDSTRPAPKGHEDLSEPWVGAGDLKLGDKVRQADGTAGTVRIVKTTQQERTMYNLDIANLDNFYVGEQGWLVHNGGCSTILNRNLNLRFGTSFGSGYQAHHLIPYQFRDDILVRTAASNWDINGGFNRIFLPDSLGSSLNDMLPIHNGLKTWHNGHKSYNSAVEFALREAHQKCLSSSGGCTPQIATSLLNNLARDLTDGIIRQGGGNHLQPIKP